MRIVLCYPVEARHVALLSETVPQAEIVSVGQEEIAREIHDTDIFCGHPKVPMDWERVVAGGRLKWIQSSAAGLDHFLVPSVVKSEIAVTSASGVLADQVAEHTVAMLTTWLRSLPRFLQAQQEHDFVRRPTRDLHHLTIGIWGFGGVGRRLAEVLQAFKTRILACDLFPLDRPAYVEHLLPPEAFEEVLGELDVLILAAPLTPETRGMLNLDRFSKLNSGALLVNVARGPLVVTEHLMQVLRDGHLGGALLDVTDPEPLPPDHPLWDLPQVLITPHVAGQSARRIDQMTEFFRDNLLRYLSGQPLRNLVDKRLGFPRRTV